MRCRPSIDGERDLQACTFDREGGRIRTTKRGAYANFCRELPEV
jgi:hypothetical protein